MGKLRVRKGPEQLKVIGRIAPQPGLEPGPLTQGSAGTRAGTEPRWAHAIPQPPRDSRAHTAARCCHGSPAPHAAPQPRELRGCSRIPGNGLGLGCAHLPGPGIRSLRLQRPCAPPGPPAKGRPLERSDARGAGEGSVPWEGEGLSAGLAGARVTWCGWQRRRHRCARAGAARRRASGGEVRGGCGGAGRRGGAAGPRAGRVGGERGGARPGCRGRSAQKEPAPRSALQPRALSISREERRQRRIHVQR